MRRARIKSIASFLPETVLRNEELASIYPDWTAEKIAQKTGIRERRVAGKNQTAGDLAFEAARRLLQKSEIDPASIDFLILCTQAPDYFLPATACIVHARLGLPSSVGALDVNQGCSGFVYALSLAKGLIETGAARRLLLLTADTYSKFIHPLDKSVRTLFGDGAAATLIEGEDDPQFQGLIGPFVFGTDGKGAPNLIVPAGASRQGRSAETAVEKRDDSGNVRSENNLYMNGAEVMAFSLSAVPAAVSKLLAACEARIDAYDYVILHQANAFMLEALRRKLGVPKDRFPLHMEFCGNTVSSTIPLVMEQLMDSGRIRLGTRLMLVGFGVGYSWAAASVVM
jgi:3-oxoacyl-[acyl-carrier-protein] synthase-3